MPILAAMNRLTDLEVLALAKTLPLWEVQNKRLYRCFRFASFSDAWAFMSQVALLAERQDHHPAWSNVRSRVDITLTTYDSGGVTTRDVRLAQAIDELGVEDSRSYPA